MSSCRAMNAKALHVTNQTADELELLAGLDWMLSAPLVVVSAVEMRPIRPADIAWAWLKLSRAPVIRFRANNGQEIDCSDTEATKRTAECAELACMAANVPCEWPDGAYQLHAKGANPYTGTREGARAAWGHVAACTQGQAIADRYRRELEAM